MRAAFGLVSTVLREALWTLPERLWRTLEPLLKGRASLVPWAPWIALGVVGLLAEAYLPWSETWAEDGFDDPVRGLAKACVRARDEVRYAAVRPPGLTTNLADLPLIFSWPLRMMVVGGCAWLGLLLASTILLAPLHVTRAKRKQGRGRHQLSHGSAAWGTAMDARRGGFLNGPPGFTLGRVQGAGGRRTDVRFWVQSHVLTLAPNGMGKGVGCVIPNLLVYPGPLVCLDVKGENHAVTARARRSLGQEVFRLDPFGLSSEPTHAFNWLQSIDLAQEACVSDAEALVDAIVVRQGGEDNHWDDSAAALLKGMILYVATLPVRERHPGRLRTLLTQTWVDLREELDTVAKMDKIAFGVPARAARTFLAKEDRERSSVLSTALRHTTFLDDPRIVRTLTHSDFDFRAIKRRPATVYIMVPAEMVTPYRRYLRATLDMALRAMYRSPPGDRDVLFLLDEFAQLGHCAQVEDAIALVRGYGVRFWILCQDVSQLKGVYKRWPTFLANATQQIFGTQDLETARLVSSALGQATIPVSSSGTSMTVRGPGPHSSGTSSSEHATGRPLMTPDEVTRLGPSEVIVLAQGQPPYRLNRLSYLEDPQLRGMWDPNPMHFRTAKAE